MMQPFPFLDLPAEIRSIVYEYLFDHPSIDWRLELDGKTLSRPPFIPPAADYTAILQTCNLIHHEATPVLFQNTVFEIKRNLVHKFVEGQLETRPERIEVNIAACSSMLKSIRHLSLVLQITSDDMFKHIHEPERKRVMSRPEIITFLSEMDYGALLQSLNLQAFPVYARNKVRPSYLGDVLGCLEYKGEVVIDIWGMLEGLEAEEEWQRLRDDHKHLQLEIIVHSKDQVIDQS